MAELAWTDRRHAPGADALYLHLPFCVSKCAYCDFASWETARGDPTMVSYAASLAALVDEVVGLGLLGECGTAYLGGGTPTLLGPDLVGLVGQLSSELSLFELSCEANPESLSAPLARDLAAAGATRVSVGVQSLDDTELAALGRAHDAHAALLALDAAMSAGLDVSCDLMCATPLQTDGTWARTLAAVTACGLGHVSVYPLGIEEGTPLSRRLGGEGPAWNSEDVQAERMLAAERALGGAGLARYEVASYARRGRACRHNVAYWTGRPYLGLGTGASSMLAPEGYLRLSEASLRLPALPEGCVRVRLTCTSSVRQVIEAGGLAGLGFDLEFLDGRQAAAEDLMLSSRLAHGLAPTLVRRASEDLGDGELRSVLGSLQADGLLDGRLSPTRRGWLLGNELYGRLWDLAGDVPIVTASC